MLEGITEEETCQYFSNHRDIILLYEINVAEIAGPYQTEFSQERVKHELERAREVLEKELAVSQRVKMAELEEIDVSEYGQPRPIRVAKHLPMEFKALTHKLREYTDIFAWLYEDMKSFDPQFYEHKINL